MLERASNVLDQMDRRLGSGEERTPSTESTSDNDQVSSPVQVVCVCMLFDVIKRINIFCINHLSCLYIKD